MSNMNMGPGPQSANRPGQMTAVMRAMSQATGPKVLRIGLVSSGRIVEERIVKQRTTVTVGPSERSTFVVQANVPANFKLFELIGNDYYLNFLDGMTGRVALATGITDIGALKGSAKRVGNAYQVKLTDDARGKVVIGETTFLFQFVAPPPVQPRPQLPLAVKGGVGSQIDWNLTTIAAFSLLLHFGLVFSFYTSSLFPWADPLYAGDDDSIVQLLKHQQDIAPPPPVETAEPEPTATATTTADSKEPDKKQQQQQNNQSQSQQKPGQQDPTKAAQLNQQAEDAKIAIMAALGGGPASKDVLKDDNGAPVNVNGLKDGSGGVSNANNNGLNLNPSGGGPLGPGKGNLQGTVSTAGGGGGDTAGQTTRPVVGNVSGSLGGMSVPVQNADAVLRSGLFPRARACYNAGLKEDPNQAGRIVITIQVGPSGDVTGASVASNSGLSAKTAACIAGGARNLKFAAPGGSGSSISVPMNFVKQ